MRFLKILSRIGLGLLIVVAAVLVVRAVLNYTEGRALARTLADLKARGIPIIARDLAPPCADKDNAARLWKAYENISPFPGRQHRVPRRPPQGGTPALDLLDRAWRDYREGRPIAPADKAALKTVILENEEALRLVAEMADKPCFLYRDPGQPLLESLPPDAVQMIRTTRLLFFSALFSAQDGDASGAVTRVVEGLKVGSLPANEGTVMGCLVAMADARIFSQFIGDVCRGMDLGDSDVKRLMDVQDPGAWRERWSAGLRGERVVFIEAGGYFTKGKLKDLGSIFETDWFENAGLWVLRPLVKKDIRQSLPAYEFLEAQAKVPYFQSRDALRTGNQRIKRRPWYAYASKAMIGDFEAAFLKVAQIEALMLSSRAGLACRLFRKQNGRYPERLEQLVPAILPEVPVDPFTGKPLVYRRDGEGFVVYSLGSNEKDDGGRMTYEITQLVMDKDDDWSWKEDR